MPVTGGVERRKLHRDIADAVQGFLAGLKMTIYGYARVSSKHQILDVQIEALKVRSLIAIGLAAFTISMPLSARSKTYDRAAIGTMIADAKACFVKQKFHNSKPYCWVGFHDSKS
jgi:hypothetical protein